MYTMVLSILHRATGLCLSAASLLFVAWIAAAAAGEAAYASVAGIFASLPVRLLIGAAIVTFWYHLFAGIRHLFWDAGYGFGKLAARASGAMVVLATFAASSVTLWLTPAGRWLGVTG